MVLSKLYPVIATEGGHFNRPYLEFFKAKYVISSSTFLSSSRRLTSYRTVITSESNPMHFLCSPYLKSQTWYFYLWPFSQLNSPWACHSVSHTKKHVLSSKANGKAMEGRLIQTTRNPVQKQDRAPPDPVSIKISGSQPVHHYPFESQMIFLQGHTSNIYIMTRK